MPSRRGWRSPATTTLNEPDAGDVIEVRLFANRVDAGSPLDRGFQSQPGGSNSTLDNAIGSASTYPASFQVGAGPTYSTIRFKADRAGTYTIQVSTELPTETVGLAALARMSSRSRRR